MVKLFDNYKGRDHVYVDEDFPYVDYTSVSAIKTSCSQKFDREGKALSAANNVRSPWFGMSVQEIVDAWEKNGVESRNQGTVIHKIVENFLSFPGKAYRPSSEFEAQVINSFMDVITVNYPTVPEHHVLTEFCVHMQVCDKDGRTIRQYEQMDNAGIALLITANPNEEFVYDELMELPREDLLFLAFTILLTTGIAGTADLIIINEERTGFWVPDIKTDKELKLTGFNGRKMSEPLHRLQDCNMEQYQLQIELYALLFEKMTGMDYLGGSIIHWDKNELFFTNVPIKRRRDEVRQLLAWYFKIGPYVKRRKALQRLS